MSLCQQAVCSLAQHLTQTFMRLFFGTQAGTMHRLLQTFECHHRARLIM